MRILLIAAVVLSLIAQAATGHPTPLRTQGDPTAIQTPYETNWIDHTRVAEPSYYSADTESRGFGARGEEARSECNRVSNGGEYSCPSS